MLDLWRSSYYITAIECASLDSDRFTCIYDTNSTYIYETIIGTHVMNTSVYRYAKLPDYDGRYLQVSGSYFGMLASNSRHTVYDIVLYKRQADGGDSNIFTVQNVPTFSPYCLTTNPDGSEKLTVATREQYTPLRVGRVGNMLLNVTDPKADLSKIFVIIEGMNKETNMSVASIFTGSADGSGVKSWPFILLLVLMVALGLGYVAYVRAKQSEQEAEASKYTSAAQADEKI